MQYEWRCNECNKVFVVNCSVDERNNQPTNHQCVEGWTAKRVITQAPSVPFQFLHSMGVFDDEYSC